MSTENDYFICRNDMCKTNNSSGGMVFSYPLDEDADTIRCEHCNSEYVRRDGNWYYKGVNEDAEELILESISDYENFHSQYMASHVYFPKLIIRGIKEPDYQGRLLSFDHCLFDELILEDIEINSSFYPISLSFCQISNLSIRNCSLKESQKKDYKSLWSFYGINMKHSDVTGKCDIEGLESRLVLVDSAIRCEMNISKSKLEYALVHQSSIAKINADKRSRLMEIYQRDGHGTPGKAVKKTLGKEKLQGLNINELIITPEDISTETIENCVIQKLVFPTGCEVLPRLHFHNCYIGEITGHPHGFDKDLVFTGCTFNEEVLIGQSAFRHALVFEECIFNKKAVFNFLDIDKDLHLSYSCFNDDLIVTNNRLGGYLKCHFSICRQAFRMEDNIVAREVNYNNLTIDGDFLLKNNDITGYLFLRQIQTGGILEINWLNANELDIDNLRVGKAVDIQNSYLKSNLRLKRIHALDTFSVSFIRLNGEIFLLRSIFEQAFGLIACESKVNLFINNEFKSYATFSTNQFSNMVQTDRNLMRGNYSWDASVSNNTYFNYNHCTAAFSLTKSKANDIGINDTYVTEYLEVNNIEANDLYMEDNLAVEGIKLYNLEVDDLIYKRNLTTSLYLYNGTFAEGIIKENNVTSEEGEALIEKINIEQCQFKRTLHFNENEFGEFEMRNTDTEDIEFLENKIHSTFLMTASNANDFELKNNEFRNTFDTDSSIISGKFTILSNTTPERMLIETTQADTLNIHENNTKEFKVSMGKYRQINMFNCKEIGMGTLNNVTINKDLSITDCEFKDELSILFCKIGNELELEKSTLSSDCRLFNNTIDGSLVTSQNNFKSNLLLQRNFIRRNASLEDLAAHAAIRLYDNTIEHAFILSNANFESAVGIFIMDNNFNNVVIENLLVDSALYFDNNMVRSNFRLGKREIYHGDSGIHFSRSLSISENKFKNAEFHNLSIGANICLHKNNFDGDINFHNTDYKMAMDFTGCYIGGSFVFYKTRIRESDGELILDNTYIDKRIAFNNCYPTSYSFKNATFNGFDIPGNWKMHRKKLILDANEEAGEEGKAEGSLKKALRFFRRRKPVYVIKENMLESMKFEEARLPYSLILHHYLNNDYLKTIPGIWKYIQLNILPDEELLKSLNNDHGRENKITDGEMLKDGIASIIDQSIRSNFLEVYFGLFHPELIKDLKNLSYYFATTDNTYEDEKAGNAYDHFRAFFDRLYVAVSSFEQQIIYRNSGSKKRDQKAFRREITASLKEQYQVLRQIYGGNGELTNEDWAYYKWMHYKNNSDMKGAPKRSKLKYLLKDLIFERIFGWGVDLGIILRSTGYMILLFAVIYQLMFWFSPGLTISWDDVLVQASDIGFIRSVVLALQTTFSAVLGDWAPIGSGSIKIPMTINAVLGVFFVTFLVGAYGRKMLR